MTATTPHRESTLGSVLARCPSAPGWRVLGSDGAVVSGITHDSRLVEAHSIFCCLRGEHVDGHDHAQSAIEAGASVLVVDHPLDASVPQVVVDDVRGAMAMLSCSVYGNPSHRLNVIGVTGTNGKTTTAHLIGEIFRHAGRPSATIGTLTGDLTTPEAPDLQRTLSDLADSGITTVAVEVSSHALVQHRVDGTRFAVSIFTNLGRDHLDLHGDEESYFRAKASLFTPGLTGLGVVNADDPAGQRILASAAVPLVAYSLADTDRVEVMADRLRFRWRGRRIDLPIGGEFNISNSIAAATAATELGISLDDIVDGLAGATPVPGRFEPIRAGQSFHVVVDYAHTPDGLAAVLRSARGAALGNRVIVVFGCGGDRDRTKRPLMGAVAGDLADLVIVTSDNPRNEDPRAIIAEIVAGFPPESLPKMLVESDRAVAIEASFRIAHPGDVVVLAGKGHETTQTIGDQVIEFDDRVVARRILGALR